MGELRRRDGSRPAAGRDVLAVAWLCLLVVLGAVAPAGAASLTNSGGDRRDGWYPDQPKLAPDLVGGGTFGQLWKADIDGQVYMQPLVLGSRVIAATETNHVYSLDSETGAPAWSVALGAPYKATDIGCSDLTPDIGVTSTPVIDQASNTIYLTHKTYVTGTSVAAWYLDALDASTGAQRPGFPVRLTGTAQNAPNVSFDAKYELQRPGLLLMDGVVYAGFGGHCDIQPYQGWVFGINTAGLITARWTSVTSDSGAGIWQSGSGLMSDGPGRIFVATGNGGSPTPPMASPGGMFGESVVRLGVQSNGSLKAMDFFAPYDAGHLDAYDADFASGGVTALRDDLFGTPQKPHVAVAVGKAGYVYLLDRDDLGGTGTGANGGDRVLSRVGPFGGVWSRPGVWPGDGGWIAIPTASDMTGDTPSPGGSSGFLKLYRYRKGASGIPSLDAPIQSDDVFGFTSSAPVITSDALTSGSAVLWIIWAPNSSGNGAQLRAYDAVPVNGHLQLRKSWPIGQSTKYAMPGVGDARIYVGTRDGHVLGFGSPVKTEVQAPATTFPTTTIGSTSSAGVTLTITGGLTITSISASPAAFTARTAGLGLPKPVADGATLTVPVDFSPAAAGSAGGALTVQTDKGPFSFTLTGTGQAQGAVLSATPATVSFGGAVVGDSRASVVSFGNSGGQPLTITGVSTPAAPFSVDNAPAAGDQIASGAVVNVTVHYQPTAAGPANDELTVQTTAGDKTIGLSGSAGVGGHLTIVPGAGWDFGAIPVGTSATASVTLSNTGDSPVTMTRSKPPIGGVFTVLDDLPEGTTIAAGDSRTLRVRFDPTVAGDAGDAWSINAADGTGVHEVPLAGTAYVPARPSATPSDVTLADSVTGSDATAAVTFDNAGGRPLTVSGVDLPGAPFTVSGAPAPGAVVAAGASVAMTVHMRSDVAGTFAGAIVVHTDAGDQRITLRAVAIDRRAETGSPATPGADPPTPAPTSPPVLTPALIGPALVAATAAPKVRADVRVERARISGDGRRVTVTGRANVQAAGALSVTLQVRRAGRRTVTVTTSGRLARGRFTVRLDLPRSARTWRSLHILVRFGGSDRAWAAAGSLVVVHGR